jgi:cytoskeletal protein RodZ
MKSIGETLKEARTKKKLSVENLSTKTKIRREFLEAIENENWSKLPEFPVVIGFVKSIAGSLKLNSETVAALLKRDYPPRTIRINPKPDISRNFIWSPKLTFWLGIIIVSFAVLGYLITQYIGFKSPPKLSIDYPKDGQLVTERQIFVSGQTESDVTVKVNNQPALVDSDGNFSTKIEVSPETKEIIVVADSRSGKESMLKVNINVNLGNRN